MLPPVMQGRITVTSAGFVGPDRPSPQEARKVAAARGIDLEDHRSKLLTRDGVADTHLIIVMDRKQEAKIRRSLYGRREQVVVLGDLDPTRIDTRTIRDPFLQPLEVFEQSYDRIDRCLAQMVDVLTERAALVQKIGSPAGALRRS